MSGRRRWGRGGGEDLGAVGRGGSGARGRGAGGGASRATRDRAGVGALHVRRRADRSAGQEVADLGHRPPIGRVLGHRVVEQRAQPAGVRQVRRLLVHDPVERAHQVVADLVRRPAGQGVEGRGAEGPHVGGRRRHLARGHLGGEVRRRAGDQARLRQGGVGLGAGDAEVRQLHLALGRDQDVRGLHVAVHDAGLVRGGQRVGGLAQQRCGLVGGEGPVLPHQLGERAPLDVLHDQPVLVALLDQVEDRDHVGVVEPGGQAGLALGALEVGGPGTGGPPSRLSATCRPSTRSVPSQTAPMPPRPTSRSSVYLPAISMGSLPDRPSAY